MEGVSVPFLMVTTIEEIGIVLTFLKMFGLNGWRCKNVACRDATFYGVLDDTL